MPSRNGPCPCGSTVKYKKCCLVKDEAAQRALAPPPRPASRIIHHRGRPLLVSGGRDLPAGGLDHAVEFYAAKDRGEGPAAQLMRFVQPLLDGCDDDAQLEKALKLGTVFWNLALGKGDEREELLARMLSTLPNERDAIEFRALANDMVKRHQAMFPTMERSRPGFVGETSRWLVVRYSSESRTLRTNPAGSRTRNAVTSRD